jgi:hypothetical protein
LRTPQEPESPLPPAGYISPDNKFIVATTLAMRAVLIENTIGDASKLYIGDAPTPIPSVDEVLVKVEFDSIALID